MGIQSNSGPNHATEGHRPSPEAVEGQMLAHRQILVLLIKEMQRNGANDLMAALESLSVMQDHQEDPGAVIDAAVAIQGALTQEVGLIYRACTASPPLD